jgi:hypothetical protein
MATFPIRIIDWISVGWLSKRDCLFSIREPGVDAHGHQSCDGADDPI